MLRQVSVCLHVGALTCMLWTRSGCISGLAQTAEVVKRVHEQEHAVS